jgi:deoxyribonuclease (pyrimidine dimer)
MTRVNVVPVDELADQHLIAEYKEICRLPALVRAALTHHPVIPSSYVMGTGHVKFFYDKLGFISTRHETLKREGAKRGFDLSRISISLDGIPQHFCGGYDPTLDALRLNRERILEKLLAKPAWYRYYGKQISADFIDRYRAEK